MSATAAPIAIDRRSIVRDAWDRAYQAAIQAKTAVRQHLSNAFREAWARWKEDVASGSLMMTRSEAYEERYGRMDRAMARRKLAGILAEAKAAAPIPVQIDLVDYIAALPPVPPAPRRFEMGPYTTITTAGVGADGEDEMTVLLTFVDGTVRTLGTVLIYSEDYDGPQAVLQEALRVIEEVREAVALSVVQQPEPAPEQTEEARLTARLAELERERDEARADFIAARRERMAIVDGDAEGDAGIAWTNEERAQADYDEAVERYEEAYQDLWHATDIAA